jgi:hypothetical protein
MDQRSATGMSRHLGPWVRRVVYLVAARYSVRGRRTIMLVPFSEVSMCTWPRK